MSLVLHKELAYQLKGFTLLGFDTLPLVAGSKTPIVKGWNNREPHRMWSDVPNNVNIGLRAGGNSHIGFIDCDEKNIEGTFTNIQAWLEGLGYLSGDYPVVQTASGIGRHVYINFAGGLEGNYCNFSSDF